MRKKAQKLTLESLAAFLKREGCELLSKEYKGTRSCIEYKAKCGHVTKIWVNNFLAGLGRYCKVCKKRIIRKALDLRTIREIFKKNGCVLLSNEYKGSLIPLRYVCQCGHINELPLYRFEKGQGRVCPQCSGSKKKTIAEVRDIFAKEGCRLLSSKYKWNRDKVEYIARCGHRHLIKAAAFFEGEGRLCPICQRNENSKKRLRYTEEDQRAMLKQNGCELISPARTTNDKMEYKAECGHIVFMRIVDFKIGYGRKCKKCYQKCISRGEQAIKGILDCMGVDYIPQYKIVEGVGKRQRIDFYMPELNVAIEYNGKQHYEEDVFFHSGRSKGKVYDFKYSQERDKRKRKWCKENGIKLIEIDGRVWDVKKLKTNRFYKYLKKKMGL